MPTPRFTRSRERTSGRPVRAHGGGRVHIVPVRTSRGNTNYRVTSGRPGRRATRPTRGTAAAPRPRRLTPTTNARPTTQPQRYRTTTSRTNPPPVAPFLTPAQQAALGNFDYNTATGIANQQRRMSDSTYNTNQSLQTAQKAHDVGANNENQSAAARGLFQSSIRAGDLNDLDATMAMRQNILNTSLQRIITDAQSSIGSLTHQSGMIHNQYNQMAVQNAMAQPPVTPTTTTSRIPLPGARPAPATRRPTSGGPRRPSRPSSSGMHVHIHHTGPGSGIASGSG